MERRLPPAGIRGAIQVIGGRLPNDSRDALVVKEIVTRIDALRELLLARCPPEGGTTVTVALQASGEP